MPSDFAFFSGADRGLGFTLVTGLLEKGWQVFAGQYLPDWPELDRLAAHFSNQLTCAPLDISSNESVQDVTRLVAQAADRVDQVIN